MTREELLAKYSTEGIEILVSRGKGEYRMLQTTVRSSVPEQATDIPFPDEDKAGTWTALNKAKVLAIVSHWLDKQYA